MNGKLYVAYSNSKNISVFLAGSQAKYDYPPLKVITVKEMQYPMDIVACPISQCCYVADSVGVWRVRDSRRDEHVDLWLDGESKAKTLSIGAGGNVLVTEFDRLCLYSPDGNQIYCIPIYSLTDETLSPHVVGHAIESGKGFFLCQPGRSSDIMEINTSGSVIRKVSNQQGIDADYLKQPMYTVQDADNNRLFVLDCASHRVILFDGTLRLRGVLIHDHIDWFKRICFVPELRLLFLCSSYGIVEIFRVFP